MSKMYFAHIHPHNPLLSPTPYLLSPSFQIVPLYFYVLFILNLESAYERKHAAFVFQRLAYFA
jgi:hypothetical protein